MKRIIAHLDMDAFFAAVEERDNPRFRGKPIVVGADPMGGKGRGVVSTANYEARKYGIRSAMPISTAWRLAEAGRRRGGQETVFTSPHFEKYEKSSNRIRAMVEKRVHLVEQASIDEMYLDLSFLKNCAEAESLAKEIKKEILDKEKLTCSVGIGPNKLIAKIASDIKKPDGLTVVYPELAEEFLEPLQIRKIPGIGPKTEELFSRKGIRFVRDLKKFSEDELGEMLGKLGTELYRKIRGRDESPVSEEREAKSVGVQETFKRDILDAGFITGRAKALAAEAMKNLGEEGFKTFRRAVVTVRFADFETKTRSRSLKEASDSPKVLEFEALGLLLPFFDARENPRKKLIRLIGVRVENLS